MGAEIFICGLDGSSRSLEVFLKTLLGAFVGLFTGEYGTTTAAGGDLG